MILASMEILLVAVAVQVLNTLIFVWSRRALLMSNLVLRQQLTVFKRRRPRPALRNGDRLFWSVVSYVWRAGSSLGPSSTGCTTTTGFM